jgi:phosphate transport system substrate-binding protein
MPNPILVPALVLTLCGTSWVGSGDLALDPDLPAYRPVDSLSGTLRAAGSDTMLQLQSLMAEEFRRLYPQVTFELEGKGSSTAPPALLENTIQIANMSRRIFGREQDAFEDRYGYTPLRFDVALDTVGIFVHRDNPIEVLSLADLDGIFSSTRRCERSADIVVWGQLGLDGRWATAPVSLYGRNAASGTYAFFKDQALCRGDFKDSVKEQPGSASVVQGVEQDPYGIGYSGIGYATSGVRTVPIVGRDGDAAIPPTRDNAVTGRYPLSRFLEVYVRRPPDEPLDRLTSEFIRYVLSRDGQRVVLRAGFHPLDARLAAAQLDKLDASVLKAR